MFDWTTDACEPTNIPDLATRAFRDSTGKVQLLLSHATGHRMTGPDLDHLTIDCTPIWTSALNADPGQYQDQTWIAAPYTEDGKTIYAIAHHEYQGHTHPGQCPSADYFNCLVTSLTLYVSKNGGDSYAPALDPPANYVAGMPEPYSPDDGPNGLRSPTNIVKGPDGALYMFASAMRFGSQKQAMCLLRTEDISDPRAWRWWNRSGFVGEFSDPEIASGGPLCREVAYLQIGAQLTTWSQRRLITEMPLPWTVPDAGSSLSVLYPSLLDPESTDRNFTTTGTTAYLYYTRNNAGHASLDRDLVRVPVEFVLDAG
ncbi:hypothetical protein [Cryobacterium psychrophilum]|uniref:DUF4185 domain-containing protein n=1 Tax=Cryobacterium psychrophilum TaxID=41988 RepID=A0A4Y8KVF0_9MICO|nr:hypothetical protein [Cryobacterium psychrophilum]TFD82417.1 hypothetical protein E3T53_00660 [Cryobacterium psychrophilum]